ncbi:MAG: amidase family protein [Myxococcota bacterium]
MNRHPLAVFRARERAWFLFSLLIIGVASTGCAEHHADPAVYAKVTCEPDEPRSADGDGDGAPDHCDNCATLSNPQQRDSDHDGIGDACDTDIDLDRVPNDEDNCPTIFNPLQQDTDDDGVGDVCDTCPAGQGRDGDADGVSSCRDNCPYDANPNQADRDDDGIGDACDNCPDTANSGQSDVDADGRGDACDEAEAFRWVEATIADVHEAIRAGEYSCAEIVEGYLQRIARHDLDVRSGAPINAFVMLNEDVRDDARALDRAYRESGQLTGPLHCVPIVIKTNYDSTDTTTTNGSFALEDTRARRDAYALDQMRERGAILIGSTGMDEFADGVHGIAGRHGRTGNPYDTAKNPGGSSAGSGAAVAASFAVGATGTDSCGSLSIPAGYNGLVTMRSTIGLVSLDGIFPGGPLDTVPGPVARSVRDTALLLDAMATRNPGDARHLLPSWRRPDTFTAYLDEDGLQDRRIGVLRKLAAETGDIYREPFTGGNAATHATWARAFSDLERLGSETVENVRLPKFVERRYSGGKVAAINKHLGRTDGPVSSYAEICRTQKWSKDVYEDVASCLAHAREGTLNPIGGIPDGLNTYNANAEHIENVMDKLRLDALVLPVDSYGAALPLAVKPNCIETAVSGLPAIVVPAGWSQTDPQMPVGLMFIARRYDEPTLLEIAYAWEQGTRWRRGPELGPGASDRDMNLGEANALRREIGWTAYTQVLQDSGKFELDAGRFRAITWDVLAARGHDPLTPDD